jgi:hypothetical protein
MKPSMFLLFILLLVGSFFPSIVRAQSDPSITQMEVAIWPEYDRHAILVIFRVQLAPDTLLPAEIQLPIPSAAGEPFAVAWQDENGQLLVADYVTEPQGDWQLIKITSGGLAAQLEYYIDYELSNSVRGFTFSWPEGFAVEEFSYEVQEPVAAENFSLSPVPEQSITGNDGLVYHLANLGPLSASSSMAIELRYSNPTAQLSAEAIAQPEIIPQISPVVAEGGTPDIYQILPWLLGGMGVILVAVGGYYFLQSRREPSVVRSASRPRKSRKPALKEEDVVDSAVVYCHQCGTRASVSDHFCRHCGVPLRR